MIMLDRTNPRPDDSERAIGVGSSRFKAPRRTCKLLPRARLAAPRACTISANIDRDLGKFEEHGKFSSNLAIAIRYMREPSRHPDQKSEAAQVKKA